LTKTPYCAILNSWLKTYIYVEIVEKTQRHTAESLAAGIDAVRTMIRGPTTINGDSTIGASTMLVVKMLQLNALATTLISPYTNPQTLS